MVSAFAAGNHDPRPFFESPLSMSERLGRLTLVENPDGDLRLKKNEDCPEALEENKKEIRNTWAHTRLNRGLLFTGYPGVICVKVERGANEWETWKNILRAENEWVEKQHAARVKRKEEPATLEQDPKRQRTMSSDPHGGITNIPYEVICSPPRQQAQAVPSSSQPLDSQARCLLLSFLHGSPCVRSFCVLFL